MMYQKQASNLRIYKKYVDILYFRHLHMSSTLYPRRPMSARKTNVLFETTFQPPAASDVIYNHKIQTDFYGIEGDEGLILADRKLSYIDKLSPDLNKIKQLPEKEFKFTNFGAVRLDAENKPVYVPTKFKNQENKSTISENFLDNTFFPLELEKNIGNNLYKSNTSDANHFKRKELSSNNQNKIVPREQPQNICDNLTNKFSVKNSQGTKSPVSYSGEYYFPEQTDTNLIEGRTKNKLSFIDKQYVNKFESNQNLNSHGIKKSQLNIMESLNMVKVKDLNPKMNIQDSIPSQKEIKSRLHNIEKQEKMCMSEERKKGISAKKEKKLDSKGFRILKHQVPSLKYFTRDEVLDLLKESILHIDDDIVVLNKPYNLVIHESSTTGDSACLSMYLADMAKMLDPGSEFPELFTVHRLDKETTGCLLLARNNMTAQRLKSLFAQRKIMKTYWIVTCKIPDPMEGIIDISISEGKVESKSRMVLHPNLPNEMPYKSYSKPGKQAITRYKVIATSGNAALVEVQPETGLKHQIRVHFGLGLSCPILGDHKYSYLDKIVPQKLSSDLLQRLRVRQSKVRHIPLHIHSKHILIPQYSEGRNLFVTAPLPKHMSENLRSMKFRKK